MASAKKCTICRQTGHNKSFHVSEKKELLTKETLKSLAKQKMSVKNQSALDYEDLEDFILFNYCQKTPQSYGGTIQERILKKNGWSSVSPQLERGDAVDKSGIYREIKSSISAEGKFNAVQIRPHHNVHYCLLAFFEIDINQEVIPHFFQVPEHKMLDIPGIGNAHGTKNSNNVQKEYRVTIEKDSDAWKFIEQHRVHNVVL